MATRNRMDTPEARKMLEAISRAIDTFQKETGHQFLSLLMTKDDEVQCIHVKENPGGIVQFVYSDEMYQKVTG